MFSRFLSNSALFFDFFDKQAMLCIQATEQLRKGVTQTIDPILLNSIKEIEHTADKTVRECAQSLHHTFITPIDRDSIYKLVSDIDDIIDCTDAAADCLLIYKIGNTTPELTRLAELLHEASQQCAVAVKGLRTLSQPAPINQACERINRLEHEADDALRTALGLLFEKETDARAIIKWKEIYETLETATDRCSDVADVIQEILLENDG